MVPCYSLETVSIVIAIWLSSDYYFLPVILIDPIWGSLRVRGVLKVLCRTVNFWQNLNLHTTNGFIPWIDYHNYQK